ncbi:MULTISPECIES: hypothetical protein [Pectobacterium]|uniref:hypothetical protein n=1 Tax=Pectobacterium TaxID=122277 RepID=UPI0004E7BA55|nr:hypothetical protein [Pectobacterium brasiliense]KFF66133.1 hypothetical protein IV99_07855 [Pectobacterium brasiliense]
MKGVFLGFIGSLVIMVATLAWGYYSSTKELTVSKHSHDVVISPATEIDGISIFYNENKISNLSKTVFTVENTGRVAIKYADVVSPVTIEVEGGSKVFDFILSEKEPSNIDASLTRDKSKNFATVNFTLLNPGDKFNVSILSDSLGSQKIAALARIDGIKNIIVKNEKNENGLAYSIFLWFCLALSAFSILLCAVFFFDYIKEIRVKSLIKSKKLDIPSNAVDVNGWANKTFSFYQGKEIAKIVRVLNENPNIKKDVKIKNIENLSKEFVSNFGFGLTFFALGGAGVWFSLNALGVI